MRLKDILFEWLCENLLLFKRPDEYRSVVAVRLIALVILTAALSSVILVIQNKIQLDLNFVLSIFAIFISWLFYWSADRNSTNQMRYLHDFLKDFRRDSQQRLENLDKRIDIVFTKPPSSILPKENVTTQDGDSIAMALSEIMKENSKQLLIALNKFHKPLPNENMTIEYVYELDGLRSSGGFLLPFFVNELLKARLLSLNEQTGDFSLSERGQKLANWLSNNGKTASFFSCPAIGIRWGTPSREFSPKTNFQKGE